MTQFAAPRKSLGQNFLQDQNIIGKIIANLNIQENDLVLEIGPGRGALTDHLLEFDNELHLVEFDRDLCEYWRDLAELNPKLTLHESDVLKFDFANVFESQSQTQTKKRIKVIGNLPYNISSPVMFRLMAHADNIHSQLFMLQKEVVDRMAAQPGNKQYGRLSVMLQYRYQIEKLFVVPATAFFPAPKVESAIVRLSTRNEIKHSALNLEDFEALVKMAFSQRRKTLRNTLKPILNTDQIESCGVTATARAETLNVNEFVALSNLFTQTNS